MTSLSVHLLLPSPFLLFLSSLLLSTFQFSLDSDLSKPTQVHSRNDVDIIRDFLQIRPHRLNFSMLVTSKSEFRFLSDP